MVASSTNAADDAAAQRAKSAPTRTMRLRKLGLAELVETNDAGYRIARAVDVELA